MYSYLTQQKIRAISSQRIARQLRFLVELLSDLVANYRTIDAKKSARKTKEYDISPIFECAPVKNQPKNIYEACGETPYRQKYQRNCKFVFHTETISLFNAKVTK